MENECAYCMRKIRVDHEPALITWSNGRTSAYHAKCLTKLRAMHEALDTSAQALEVSVPIT